MTVSLFLLFLPAWEHPVVWVRPTGMPTLCTQLDVHQATFIWNEFKLTCGKHEMISKDYGKYHCTYFSWWVSWWIYLFTKFQTWYKAYFIIRAYKLHSLLGILRCSFLQLTSPPSLPPPYWETGWPSCRLTSSLTSFHVHLHYSNIIIADFKPHE